MRSVRLGIYWRDCPIQMLEEILLKKRSLYEESIETAKLSDGLLDFSNYRVMQRVVWGSRTNDEGTC